MGVCSTHLLELVIFLCLTNGLCTYVFVCSFSRPATAYGVLFLVVCLSLFVCLYVCNFVMVLVIMHVCQQRFGTTLKPIVIKSVRRWLWDHVVRFVRCQHPEMGRRAKFVVQATLVLRIVLCYGCGITMNE